MAESREWTEWHLTPRGWESGTTKRDCVGVEEKPAPEDRVLSVEYEEEWSSPFSKGANISIRELWRGADKENIAKLLEKHGSCPKHL